MLSKRISDATLTSFTRLLLATPDMPLEARRHAVGHRGSYRLGFLNASNVVAKVVAVEPHPRCFSILQAKFANRNSSCTFVLAQKAGSRTPGKLKLWQHKCRGRGRNRLFFSSLYKKLPMQDTPILVEGRRLDWFIERYNPHVVKLNAEGCEVELGCCSNWKRVRTIICERD